MMFAFSTFRTILMGLGKGNFFGDKRRKLAGILAAVFCVVLSGPLAADSPSSRREESPQVRRGESIRQLAIGAIPLDKLDGPDRMKVRSVLENTTLFHRMPVRVIDCDPDLYLFITRHPDVAVNIWNVLKISQLQLRETAPKQYWMKETTGTTVNLELLYQSHDTQLLYAEGDYRGSVALSVKGRALFLLKTNYLRDTDNRYYISSRMDMFLSVEPGAVQWVTKTLQPILGSIADNNFHQTVAFVGSLSRTIEVNSRGVQRLGTQLNGVSPQIRNEFIKLTDDIARKPTAVALRQVEEDVETARQQQKTIRRY
jgi:hypothetical protein